MIQLQSKNLNKVRVLNQCYIEIFLQVVFLVFSLYSRSEFGRKFIFVLGSVRFNWESMESKLLHLCLFEVIIHLLQRGEGVGIYFPLIPN